MRLHITLHVYIQARACTGKFKGVESFPLPPPVPEILKPVLGKALPEEKPQARTFSFLFYFIFYLFSKIRMLRARYDAEWSHGRDAGPMRSHFTCFTTS
jgi:hypothetical protein